MLHAQRKFSAMEFFNADTRRPIDVCLEQVRASDIFIGIIAHKYGSIVPGTEKSFTQMEYEEAIKKEIPCLIYLRDKDVPIKYRLTEQDPKSLEKLQKFIEHLKKTHTPADFQQGGDLAYKIIIDLSQYTQESLITEMNQYEYEAKFPKLEKKNLDIDKIQLNIDKIFSVFQETTIIPEAFSTIIHEKSNDLISLGFNHRYPVEWFQPKQETMISNEIIFDQAGRAMSQGEKNFLQNRILENLNVKRYNTTFSKENILDAVNEIEKEGYNDFLLWPTIESWITINTEMKVDYGQIHDKHVLNSTLIIDDYKMRLIPPLGKIPTNNMILAKEAVTWHIEQQPEYGPLYIDLGNDRLYPEKYVELICFTNLKCEIKEKGIIIFN